MLKLPNKRIFIPFRDYRKGIGGPSTFMRLLEGYLDNNGFGYANTALWIKAIFFPIEHKMSRLERFKKRGIKIIQRVDGVYYPSMHGASYTGMNRNIGEIHGRLADFVIYQSNYSKRQCETMFGPCPGQSRIIINGADKTVFYPAKNVGVKNVIRLFCNGVFRHINMLKPIIDALDSLSGYKFQLKIAGPVVNENLIAYTKRPYIIHTESMNPQELAEELRASDIFIYSILNPSCPNSVIEAASCGVPVVGFSTGAMEELLHFNSELLAEVSGEVFQRPEDFDSGRLAQKLALCFDELPRFRKRAEENAHLYPFEETGKSYLDIFKKVLAGA